MSLLKYSNIIYPLVRNGKSFAEIFRAVHRRDSTVTYKAIRQFVKTIFSKKISSCRRIPYRARALQPHIQTVRTVIEDSYKADSSTTARAVVSYLRSLGIAISSSYVKVLRNKMGFRRTTTKYCQVIRDENKEKRLEFCKEMLSSCEDFADCIFTDECTLQVDCTVKYCYVQKGDHFGRMRSRAKHPAKLHVWGGISSRGTTELAIFPGHLRMDSKMYCQILECAFLRFNKDAYHGYGTLVQDNAPQHKSSYTSQVLSSWGVKVMDWPPESPDLNPIELVWGNMKNNIRKNKNVRTLDELRDEVIKYWKSLTPEICSNYIRGIPKKMNRVVEQRGRNIYEGK